MSDLSQSTLQAVSNDLSTLVQAAAAGVVAVHSHRSVASGFVWRNGLVVTADEALAHEGDVTVTFAGAGQLPATVVGRDASTDVALLKVATDGSPPVALAARTPSAGSLCVVVGLQEAVPLAAFGVVALAGPKWRSMRGGSIDARLELDVRLRRHAEGGLVVDPTGHAFGMAVFGPRRRALVIPAATIERVAAMLERHGRIPQGYLGLGLQPVRVDRDTRGAMVTSVDENGPGKAADVRQGDVIVSWDGVPIGRLETMLQTLGPESVGRSAVLGLRRSGAPVDVKLTIGERAAG